MRILMLHKYGRKAASFRQRFEQYLPYLERAGHTYTVASLLDDDYLESRLKGGRRDLAAAAGAAFRHLGHLLHARQFDLVVIGVELFPYFPALFEKYLALLRVPYVFDFDDPIFHYYDLSPHRWVRALLGNKVRQVITGAAGVFAGSPYLVDYARQFNSRVEYLPTVIDLDRYPVTRDFSTRAERPFTIGWIGSSSTAPYLEQIRTALEEVQRYRPTRLVLVGAGSATLGGIPSDIRPWSEERESTDILKFDVGIMPLTDDAWSRGKCGFKLIQYMATGIPVVASPVGVNREIVEPGVNGYLPASSSGWVDAFLELSNKSALAAKMGAAGRRKVEQKYCVQVTAPLFVQGLEQALSRSTPGNPST